jgi:spore coat protein CotH
MNAKEIIEKLKITFNELVKNAEVPQAPTTPSAIPPVAPEMIMPIKGKLKDGTEVEITELQVGGIVTIQGTPAPIGEHTMEDGTIIVVGDNGAIMEIKMADGTMPPMVEDMGAKFSAFENTTKEKFASYETKFADYEAKFATYESRLNKATQVIEGLLNLTQTLAETPTGTPDASVKTNNNFNTQKKEMSYDILFS